MIWLALLAAAPEVIVFGGGWGPEGTQASIEAHVDRLCEALAPAKPVRLFAGGPPGTRAVQELAEPDPASALLGLVFERNDGLAVRYRPPVKAGPSATKSEVMAQLERAVRNPNGVVMFGAGHGSPAEAEIPAGLELWGPDDRLGVTELATALDRWSSKGPVALVLGQCHSGAFTALAHRGGVPTEPLATPARCALAAIPADRQASGCTADVDDPEARAYLALIAEAFAQKVDLDGDGKTSILEAHAHARVFDRTIDVPVSSSELWLERQLGKKAPSLAHQRQTRLLEWASPAERAVLSGLMPERKRREPKVLLEAEAALTQERTRVAQQMEPLSERAERLRRQVLDRLLTRWPELSNPYHPESRRLLAGGATEIVQALNSDPELLELQQVLWEVGEKDQVLLGLDKELAVLERWRRSAQRVLNERQLRMSKNVKLIKSLEQLLACESVVP